MSDDQHVVALTWYQIAAKIRDLSAHYTGHRTILEKIMYAVIKTGGKQYRVTQGDVIKVEKLKAAEGDTVELGDVIMVADGDEIKVGMPFVKGSKVTAQVVSHGRGDKVEIVKFRRRKHFDKQMGHRQAYTEIEIKEILGEGGAKLKTAPEPRADSQKAAKKKADSGSKSASGKTTAKKKTAKKATAKKATAKKATAKKAPAKKATAKKATAKKKTSKKSTAKKKKT